MHAAIVPVAPAHDVVIMAAAVADFTVAEPAGHKIKKGDGGQVPDIRLVPTHDFLVDLGRDKPTGQVLVGFEHDTNAVVILGADGSRTTVALASKRVVADAVLDAIVAVRQNAE